MKHTIATLCILGASLAGFSQDKNFDLSKYKFPDYKRHQLDFSFSSDGHDESHSFEQPKTDSYDGLKYDSYNSGLNTNLRIDYRYNYLTRKTIDQVYSSFDGRYDYSKNKHSGGDKTEESTPNFHFNLNASRRIYLTEDKFFMEGVAELYYDNSRRKIEYNDVESNSDNYYSSDVNLSAGIGIGLGRIERVNDLWQGYYILEKLRLQNSLSRELQENDIFEFSTFISKLKNKRFFDYRLRKIAELQALDSLLHQQNLLHNTDILYFTTLNDYWSFPVYFDRKSGRELKFQVLPGFESDYYKSGENYSNTPVKTDMVTKIQFDCDKQINLFWERNFHIDLVNTTLIAKNKYVSDSYPVNWIATNASIYYGFFPNTRTRVTGSFYYHGNEDANLSNNSNSKSWFNSCNLDLGVNYYISPQLQIAGSLNGSYYFSKENSNHGHNIYYNLSLSYAIF